MKVLQLIAFNSVFLFGLFLSPSLALSDKCPTLSSSADLLPVKTPAPVVDLEWAGTEDLNVFAMTRNVGLDSGGIWKSKNGGDSFTDLTPKLNSSMQKVGGSEGVNIISVFSQKSAPSNVVFLGTGSYIWLSRDYGETMARVVRTPGHWRGSAIRSMKVHPTHDDWLLVLVRRPDCRLTDQAFMECPHDLFLTQDLFSTMTWLNLTENSKGAVAGFVDFDWGLNACPVTAPGGGRNCSTKKDMPEPTIMATMYAKPGDYDQPWDPDVHFVMSSNLFKSFETHVQCGNMFEVVGEGVYIAMANSCPVDVDGRKRKDASPGAKGITLYTSVDGGYHFDQACLPVALKQEGYELLETHDGRGAVIVVDFTVGSGPGGAAASASSVYTAGPHHALFSLSLTNVHHSDFGLSTDLSRIEGMPGFFVANQMLPSAAIADDYDSDLTGAGNVIVESRITYNGGGRWQRIPAPTTFLHKECNLCNGVQPCFLHLNGPSSWDSLGGALPALYSSVAAPGLLLATGNVAPLGAGLNGLDGQEGLCTWLSNDGGVTWRDVAAGAYIYEYADWGGVVVMAKHSGGAGEVADRVLVSTDYGGCWAEVPLKESLLVDNIRIEPDGQRPRVILHGRGCRVVPGRSDTAKCGHQPDGKYTPEGLMYVVDVEQLFGAALATTCGALDYTRWTVPSADAMPACVLGQTMQMTRRRADVLCLNGASYSRPAPVTDKCNCTQEDIECDFGWMMPSAAGGVASDHASDTCVQLPASRMPQCPLVSSGKYIVSKTGKRLVHGDTCAGVGGVIPDTDGTGARQTPGGKGGKSGGGGKSGSHHGLWSFFALLLFVGAAAAWWFFLASEAAKDLVLETAETAASFAIGLVLLAKERAEALCEAIWVRCRGGRAGDTLLPTDDLSGGGGIGGGLGLINGSGTAAEEELLGYFQPLGDGGAGSVPGGVGTSGGLGNIKVFTLGE